MVLGTSSQVSYTVVSALSDEYSGGKARKEYCKRGESLFVISDTGNVLIVFGPNGRFPILKSNTQEEMIQNPQDLINAIKAVDLKSAYMFPIEFLMGVLENKSWKNDFIEDLKKSDVRASLKNEILSKINE